LSQKGRMMTCADSVTLVKNTNDHGLIEQ